MINEGDWGKPPPYPQDVRARQATEVSKMRMCHNDLDSSRKVQALLKGKPPGTWLIRPSNNPGFTDEPSYLGFCVSIVEEDGTIDHQGLFGGGKWKEYLDRLDKNKAI
jgi:hypothetical protein